MNMHQIVLEAMSNADYKASNEAANRDLVALGQSTFQTANGPITVAEALKTYKSKPNDLNFLFELGKSLLPERQKGASLFFGHELSSYKGVYPLAAAMKDGPQIFELFGKVVGARLSEEALSSSTTTFGKDGETTVTDMDNDRGLRAMYGTYYPQLERELKDGYTRISKAVASTDKGQDYQDAVLYAAYIRYMFNVLLTGCKALNEANGKTDSKANLDTDEIFTHGAYYVNRVLTERMKGASLSAMDNWGSTYNQGESDLKVIEPTRMNTENVSKFKIYPRYVIDLVRLRNNDKSLDTFLGILRSHNYADVAQGLEKLGSIDDTSILSVTVEDLKTVLSDEGVLRDCFNSNIGDIFSKGKGSNPWVGQKSLSAVLAETPRMNNADVKYARVFPVAVGQPVRDANTYREHTGDGIITQSNKKMVVGRGTIKKTSKGNTITFKTVGSKDHTFKVDASLDSKLAAMNIPYVIARKVKEAGDGHEYFLSVPFGVAFAAMQDDAGNIVSNNNPDTLCNGLKRNNDDVKYPSVQRLMNSPIGKYCNAVAALGKRGRIRFNSDSANKAYAEVLKALQSMKGDGQIFNPPAQVPRMSDAANVLRMVLAATKGDGEEIQSTVQPLLVAGLRLSREVYSPETGRFTFENVRPNYKSEMATSLIQHLKEMYNLDNTNADDGYTKEDVQNILDVVVPGVWNLEEWDYGDILDTDEAFNPGSASTDPDNIADPSEDALNHASEIQDVNDVENPSEDTADDVSGIQAAPDAMAEEGEKVDNAVETVYENLKSYPNFGRNEVEDTERLKRNLVAKFREMETSGELNIDIAEATDTIQATKVGEFIKKFNQIKSDVLNTQLDTDDKTLYTGFFTNTGMSTPWLVGVVKNVVSRHLGDSVDDNERELMAELGGLMAKFAIVSSRSKNDISSKLTSEYLVSTFESMFDKEYHEDQARLDKLVKYVNSTNVAALPEDAKKSLERDLSIASKNRKLYDRINDKLVDDREVISRVADIIEQNVSEIRQDAMGMSKHVEDNGGNFVRFDSDTVEGSDSAGQQIVNFCTYNTEAGSLPKLYAAFGDADVASMMDALYNFVPSESISTDSIKNEKSVDDLDNNLRSLLNSYYSKTSLRQHSQAYQNLFATIDKIYGSLTDAKDMFAVPNGGDTESPYTYNGTPIDIGRVKTFFNTLMDVADSYNKLGVSKTTSEQIRTQQTLNNEELAKHVLHNQYFMTLKSRFDEVCHKVDEGRKFDANDKKVMDLVMKQVVSNPMNVLINNNVKLVTAYAYYKASVEKGADAQTQSKQAFGQGIGNEVNTSIKGKDVEPGLRGISQTIDTSMAVLKLSDRIVHSEEFVQKTLDDALMGIDEDENRAESDYESYLADIDGDGARVRILLKKVVNAGDSRNAVRQNIIDNEKVFCNYGDEDIQFRVNELIVLLYKTAYMIWSRIPKASYERIVDALNAHSTLLHGEEIKKVDAMIPQDLKEKFANLSAELQLADPETYAEKILDTRNSNHDVYGKASNVMNEFDVNPSDRTDELIETLISDKVMDDDAESINSILTSMDKKGKLNIQPKGNLDVKNVGATTVIQSNIILYVGDTIWAKVNGAREFARVEELVPNADKTYVISNIPGLKAGDKDIQFVRFQKGNDLVGGNLTKHTDAVISKMKEWSDDYEEAGSVPKDIVEKAGWLKMLYSGAGCAKVVKSLISYYAWKISHYAEGFKPYTLVTAGDNPGGKYFNQLIDAVASDMQKYKNTDKPLYEKIKNLAERSNLLRIIGESYTLSSPSEVRSSGKESAKMITDTKTDVDTTRTLKNLVDEVGEYTGFVCPRYIETAIKSNIDPNDPKGAEKAENLIKAVQGAYKTVLNDLIKKHNWDIARPLVEDYKNSHSGPDDKLSFDDAIEYIKANYTQKKYTDSTGNGREVVNRDSFADYIRNNCRMDVEGVLKS